MGEMIPALVETLQTNVNQVTGHPAGPRGGPIWTT
jgi:hypothetical protein